MADELEACEVCGFVWASVEAAEVTSRIAAGAGALAELLAGDGAAVMQRPTPGRWSVLEYAGHVRDVVLHVRDRMVIGLSEDDPEFKPLYRDQRVDLGLYVRDTPEIVAGELVMAADLYGRTFSALDDEQLGRLCQYAFPTLRTRTLLWMSQQVVHEVEHHLGDAREDLRLLTG